MIGSQSYKWFLETTTPVEGHMHAIRRTIVHVHTKFQEMEILETAAYGKCLILDGRIQSSQADEFIYHEALVHPGLLLPPAPARALVIGGGEGATLREILRHRTIARAVMVDIDEEVVEACRRHLPEMHQGAFDDPRTEVRHEDARAYLERTDERFDLVVVDLTEPLEEGPACLLFTREFYALIRDRLTPRGAMTMQAGMTKVGETEFFSAVHRTLREVFPAVAGYQTFVSCYGAPWGFMVASRGTDPRSFTPEAVDRLIRERVIGELRYWDGQTHTHAFSLPKHIRAAIDRETRVITDANPLIVK
jgi:spermidine synthase